MKQLLACGVLGLCAGALFGQGVGGFDRAAATRDVSAVLDALHHDATVADESAYLALFAPEGVFIGTDATERWTREEFQVYVHKRFATGQGWTYVPRAGMRHVEFDPTGQVAWFDEILVNDHYGETRGTGVLRFIGGEWKIAQYHLTIPLPNELADTVAHLIRLRHR
ncbi:MAG TPA: nuclear transport factor 2 family protein [Gemmatimonadales bacterium]|nr:nuclear transport factor 2 family protein [Gemmatimonadales bacterium]